MRLQSEPELIRQPHDHVVQFYEDDRFLIDAVSSFLTAGMLAGESAVVIATESHRQALSARLEAESVDVDGGCFRGRLLLLDAERPLTRSWSMGCRTAISSKPRWVARLTNV
jgi:hypothetical protein